MFVKRAYHWANCSAFLYLVFPATKLYLSFCIYAPTHSHSNCLWNGDVWSICIYLLACLIEQMRTYVTEKQRDSPPRKSVEDWIIKPDHRSPHVTLTTIPSFLPDIQFLLKLQPVLMATFQKGLFLTGRPRHWQFASPQWKSWSTISVHDPSVLWQGYFNWEEGNGASSWSWPHARVIQGHVNPSAECWGFFSSFFPCLLGSRKMRFMLISNSWSLQEQTLSASSPSSTSLLCRNSGCWWHLAGDEASGSPFGYD